MKKTIAGIAVISWILAGVALVNAQAGFQLSPSDWKAALGGIRRGHDDVVLEIINDCFAGQETQDAITATGFGVEYTTRLETQQTHIDKIAELAAYVKDGYIRIEVDGEIVPVENITVDGSISISPGVSEVEK